MRPQSHLLPIPRAGHAGPRKLLAASILTWSLGLACIDSGGSADSGLEPADRTEVEDVGSPSRPDRSVSDADAPPVSVGYVDLTALALPDSVLDGRSMDAAAVDVDADGDLDLVVASEFQTNILLLNDGGGRFTDGSDRLPRTRRDSEDVAVADFNGDGAPDLVIVSEDDQVNEFYLNDGAGRFTDESNRLPVGGVSNAVVTADLNGDDLPDLVIGNAAQNQMLINDGTGGFRVETSTRLPDREDPTQDLELADVDGDRDLDLLVGNEDVSRILYNDGKGRFLETLDLNPDTPSETREIDALDAEGDGDLDLVLANIRFLNRTSRRNRLFLQTGVRTYVEAPLPLDDDDSFDIDAFDLDGDGDLDLLSSNLASLRGDPADAPFRAYLNDGSGTFRIDEGFLPSTAVGNGFDAEFGDFDGDGLQDIYLCSRGGTDRLLMARLVLGSGS